MAGMLPKQPEDFYPIPGAKVAIISAMWHPQYIARMIAQTRTLLLSLGVDSTDISQHALPGSLELPFAARTLFEAQPELDAIIAFGVVLKGDTTHDDSVIQTVVDGFSRVSDRFNKPVINEVIGVKQLEDAEARAEDKGTEAVFALTELLHWKKTISEKSS